MTDFDAATRTCRSWAEYLESTVEGAANQLARWEVDKASELHWCSTQEMTEPLFHRNFKAFNNSWALLIPLVDQGLHLKPLEQLHEAQLEEFRDFLESFGNQQVTISCGATLEPSDAIWVSLKHRGSRWSVLPLP